MCRLVDCDRTWVHTRRILTSPTARLVQFLPSHDENERGLHPHSVKNMLKDIRSVATTCRHQTNLDSLGHQAFMKKDGSAEARAEMAQECVSLLCRYACRSIPPASCIFIDFVLTFWCDIAGGGADMGRSESVLRWSRCSWSDRPAHDHSKRAMNVVAMRVAARATPSVQRSGVDRHAAG